MSQTRGTKPRRNAQDRHKEKEAQKCTQSGREAHAKKGQDREKGGGQEVETGSMSDYTMGRG